MIDKCQARWGDTICTTWHVCTWIMWWEQMLIRYVCRCRKKGKMPRYQRKVLQKFRASREGSLFTLMIWTFMRHKLSSMQYCVEAFWQRKPESIFDIWKPKASIGTTNLSTLPLVTWSSSFSLRLWCHVHPWWWDYLRASSCPCKDHKEEKDCWTCYFLAAL